MAEPIKGPFQVVDEATADAAPIAAAGTGPTAQPISGFQVLPEHANGMSDITPLNESPLSIPQRFQMGLGNDKGRMDFLRNNFEDVKKNKDGDFLIKKEGLWYRADGVGMGDPDAWKTTKGLMNIGREAAGELAENAPLIAAIGGSIAAGIATGGASLLAQAGAAAGVAGAVEGVRTSLGRIEGTYKATPDEQLKDIAFESILNAGGVYLAAGVKPTAQAVSKLLDDWVPGVKKLPASARETIKNLYGRFTVGGENIDELIENPMVRSQLKWAASRAGGNDAEVAKVLTRDSIQTANEAARTGRRMLNEIYTKMEDELVAAVPKNFSANIDQVANKVFVDALNDGLVMLKTVGDNPVKLSQARALQLLSQNGGKLPKGVEFALRSQDELAAAFRRGGVDVADAAFVSETHGALKSFFETLSSVSTQGARGERGVRQLMKASAVLDDVTYQLSQQGKDMAVNSIPARMAQFHDVVRKGVVQEFEKYGAGKNFTALNDSYSQLRKPLEGLLKAARQAEKQGIDTPLENFVARLGTRPGKSEAVKEGFEQAVQVANNYGVGSAKAFEAAQTRIRANRAAGAFNPLFKPNVISGTATLGAAGSLAMGNPVWAAGLAAGAVATSPRGAYGTTLLVNSMWKQKQFLEGLGAKGVQQLFSNDAARNAFATTVMQVPQVEQATQEHLLGPIGLGQGTQR